MDETTPTTELAGAQDEPASTLATIVERVEALETRVNSLEQENETLQKENEKLRTAVVALEDDKRALEETIDALQGTIDDLTEQTDLVESRVDGVCNSLDDVEDDLKQARLTSERKHADLAQRLSKLEETLDLDAVNLNLDDIDDDAPVIERFASLPTSVKESELSTSTARATIVYENFTDWGDYTPEGYVIDSSSLKRLLSTALDEELEWSQVYRVMEAFDEGTPAEYAHFDHDTQGRILVRYHDTTQARAEVATNGVVSGD